MSQDGHRSADDTAPDASVTAAVDDPDCADWPDPTKDIVVVTFPMPAGSVFDWHTHVDHQLAWAARGVLTVRTASAAWVLPPTRALWIPAGVRHETLSEGIATMRTAYVKPDTFEVPWPDCTPVVATPLLTELIGYLEDPDRSQETRVHAERMLIDLLEPVAATSVDVPMPNEERARAVAESLAEAPADDRTLAEWGHDVGASSRTLARAFLDDTGLTFGRWRALLRMRLAMLALAEGTPVSTVATNVGYGSTSAFVSAFRKETGLTPAAYFRVAR